MDGFIPCNITVVPIKGKYEVRIATEENESFIITRNATPKIKYKIMDEFENYEDAAKFALSKSIELNRVVIFIPPNYEEVFK